MCKAENLCQFRDQQMLTGALNQTEREESNRWLIPVESVLPDGFCKKSHWVCSATLECFKCSKTKREKSRAMTHSWRPSYLSVFSLVTNIKAANMKTHIREIYKENEQAMTHRPEMDWVQVSWYRTLNLYKNPLSAKCKVISLRYPCESFLEGGFL